MPNILLLICLNKAFIRKIRIKILISDILYITVLYNNMVDNPVITDHCTVLRNLNYCGNLIPVLYLGLGVLT